MKLNNLLIAIITTILLSALLSTWGLTESSEARYAEISREMYTSGDYLHPRLLGIQHYHKPPITYYITSLGYFIFGMNEFGARFFLSIAFLVQLLLVLRIAQLLYSDTNISIASMLIYFSYPVAQVAAKNLTTDVYLTTFIFSAIYFFLQYQKSGKAVIYIYLFYIFCGLSFVTKGPVGILPQALFAIIYSLMQNTKPRFTKHILLALLLCVAICASWFVFLLYYDKKFLTYFIQYQLVDRVASDVFKRSKPFWYYIAFMPLLSLPAFVYFADYLGTNFLLFYIKKNIVSALAITLLICFIVFSASSSKLILYVLPLYLFIAIISAKHLMNINLNRSIILGKITIGFSVFLFLAIIMGCFIKLPVIIPKIPLLLFSITGLVCIILFSKARFDSPKLKAPFINAFSMAILILMLPFLMKDNEIKINSIKPLANFINAHLQNKPVGYIAVYDYLLPSLAFYTNQNILTLDNGSSISHRETQFETNGNSWHNNYFKLNTNGYDSILSIMLNKPNSFIIALKQNPLPDSLSFFKKNFAHKAIMDKWIIYF